MLVPHFYDEFDWTVFQDCFGMNKLVALKNESFHPTCFLWSAVRLEETKNTVYISKDSEQNRFYSERLFQCERDISMLLGWVSKMIWVGEEYFIRCHIYWGKNNNHKLHTLCPSSALPHTYSNSHIHTATNPNPHPCNGMKSVNYNLTKIHKNTCISICIHM